MPDYSAHTDSNGGNNHCVTRAISPSSTVSENSNSHPCCRPTGDQQEFQHTIIHVSPADARHTTDTTIATCTQSTSKTGGEERKRQSAKIIRAQALRPRCTSLPSLEAYRGRLSQLHLRRASHLPISQRQRCSSAQPRVPSESTKANSTRPAAATRELALSREDTTSVLVVDFTHLSPSSSTLSVGEENYSITTRPPSRHGIAYEIVFSAPSAQRCYTPQPRARVNSYSSTRATATESATTAEEFDFDDWNSDVSESEELENVDDLKESEQKANVAPQCKYGKFFTAAKPPLPPSALERIRRYRNYEV